MASLHRCIISKKEIQESYYSPMRLITSNFEWVSYRDTLPDTFNLFGNVRGKPREFPCLVHARPQSDANGFFVYCVFFYTADAKILLDSRPLEPDSIVC